MQPDAMMEMLKSLKLHGMAQALGELAAQDSPAYQSASLVLAGLLKAEMAAREVRSLAYQMKVARFPAYRDLNGFDFGCSDVNEATVRQLHRCEFMTSAHNVVLVGGPGTGKTHLATAIGVQAIERDRSRVRFFSTIELVNALEQEKLTGKPGQLAVRLMYADLVILDELGYLPFPVSGGQMLFHLISRLYERTSIGFSSPGSAPPPCGRRSSGRDDRPAARAAIRRRCAERGAARAPPPQRSRHRPHAFRPA